MGQILFFFYAKNHKYVLSKYIFKPTLNIIQLNFLLVICHLDDIKGDFLNIQIFFLLSDSK